MPSHTTNSVNLTASVKTANLLAGDILEFIPYNAVVKVYGVSSAIGVNMIVMADSDVAVDDKEIPFVGTTLSKSDHLVDSFMVRAGTRLAVFLRETAAAGTIDVYTHIEVIPL